MHWHRGRAGEACRFFRELAQESFLAGSRAGIKAITDGFRVVCY